MTINYTDKRISRRIRNVEGPIVNSGEIEYASDDKRRLHLITTWGLISGERRIIEIKHSRDTYLSVTARAISGTATFPREYPLPSVIARTGAHPASSARIPSYPHAP